MAGMLPEKDQYLESDSQSQTKGVILTDVESRQTQRSCFGRFIDSFKPAELNFDPTGMTEEQIQAAIIDHSPLKRSLKPRHISMIAIGGAIGSGLFIGSGNNFANGGPAGVIISFGLMGVMLFCVMQALAEVAVAYPVGGSFYTHTTRFVDPSLGFALGWNYFAQWLVTFPLELVAASMVLQFWKTDDNPAVNVNPAAWVALFYVVLSGINVFGVRGYGESEFILSLIKVLAIIGFCIMGVVVICGGGPNHEYIGGRYWHDPGAFSKGFKGVISTLLNAAFAFSGTEFAGLAAAETRNPAISLPRAVKQTFWRVLLFYITSLTIVGCLVRHDLPGLGTGKDGSTSPFVIAIIQAGIKGLPSVMNTVILLSTLSVGLASVYGTSRVLAAMGAQGQAPRICAYVDREGRPMVALAITIVFGLLGFLAASPKQEIVFDWLLAFAGLSTLFAWALICLSQIRLRRGMSVQGVSLDTLCYQAPGGVIAGWIGFIMNMAVLGLQFWIALFPLGEKPSAEAFFSVYLSFPVMLIFYVGHKIYYKTPLFIRAKDMDLVTGTRNADLAAMNQEAREHKENIRNRSIFIRLYYFFC